MGKEIDSMVQPNSGEGRQKQVKNVAEIEVVYQKRFPSCQRIARQI